MCLPALQQSYKSIYYSHKNHNTSPDKPSSPLLYRRMEAFMFRHHSRSASIFCTEILDQIRKNLKNPHACVVLGSVHTHLIHTSPLLQLLTLLQNYNVGVWLIGRTSTCFLLQIDYTISALLI